MDNDQLESKIIIDSSNGNTATGAVMRQEYMGRTVKTYPVHATEIETISSLNTQATVFISVATAILSYAVAIWTNARFYNNITPAGVLAIHFFAPLLVIIGVVFIALAIVNVLKRKSIWKNIKSDSSKLQ